MFSNIIFLLIALCSSYASGSENNIPAEPYTAEQHLKDIKILLEPLKYKRHEIGLFEQKKRDLNQTVDVLNEALEKSFKEENNNNFLIKSMLLIGVCIYKETLVIPGHKSLSFYKQFQDLVKKRKKALDRLKKENQNIVNIANSIENKTDN